MDGERPVDVTSDRGVTSLELPRSLWERIDKEGPLWEGTPCWVWQANRNRKGYGQFWWLGRTYRAHRLVYASLVRPIAEGLEIDHLCCNPSCCNPVHLEAVPRRINVRRGRVAKHTWPACALCGDPDGRSNTNMIHPFRVSGRRFGLDGTLCARCYNRLYLRERRARVQ